MPQESIRINPCQQENWDSVLKRKASGHDDGADGHDAADRQDPICEEFAGKEEGGGIPLKIPLVPERAQSLLCHGH